MRILYVSPYPPLRDGIAAYAVQQVAALRAQGHDVEVLSPGPSAAHHHLDLRGPRGALALGKRVRAYDRVVVQFHPDFFFPAPTSDGQRAVTAAALAATFTLARDVEVVVHEVDYRHGTGRSPGALATRAMWHAADSIGLHTTEERDRFAAAFGVPASRLRLLEHGAAFVRRTRHDRASARRSLDLPAEGHVFLTIGFIQPHKGFDRAVRAFRGLDKRGARLYVVGSLRVEDAAYQAHLEELRQLVETTHGASLEVGYASDELFDRWLVAADTVVLPYRHIWSSGVLERAALYDRRVIVTAVGGLASQIADRPGVTAVTDDAGLRRAMWAAAGGVPEILTGGWPEPGPELRTRIQDEVIARAARRRGAPVVPGGSARPSAGTSSLSAPLRTVPAFAPPAPVSGRPGATIVKKAVRRVTGWLVDPLYWQVNALRDGMINALDQVDRRGTGPGDAASPGARR